MNMEEVVGYQQPPRRRPDVSSSQASKRRNVNHCRQISQDHPALSYTAALSQAQCPTRSPR